jgi:PAS domain S-box-containing protein
MNQATDYLAMAREWQATFDAIQDAVMILDPDYRIVRANTATASFLGVPPDSLVGARCHQLFHGKDCPNEGCPSRAALRSNRHEEAEVFIEAKGVWLHVSSDPILDAAGSVTGIVHTARDITERKAARNALIESQAQLLALVESTLDMIWCVDPKRFGLMMFNTGLKDYFQQHRGIQIEPGMTPDQLLPKRSTAQWRAFYRRALREGPFVTEYVTTSETHVLLLSLSPLMRGAEVFGISVFGRDITALRKSENQLQQLHERLAHAARVSALGQLTSALAHELNQPLGAILTNADAAELLLQSTPPALKEVRSILADIRKDNQRASEVIQRLRRLLKRRELQMVPLRIEEIIQETVALLRSEIASRKVSVRVEVTTGLPPVAGDRVHLEQVLLNLMVNGMDAMDANPPEARRLVVRASHSDERTVAVEVSDCGHGIPADQLSRIFDPFHSTKREGLGMGLAISRTLIQAHGGGIEAHNNRGPGATLRFTLPALSAPEGEAG